MFANKVKFSLLNVEKLNELHIQSIISDIVNWISMTSENIVQSIQYHNSCNHQILKSLHDCMKNFFAEKFFITLHDSAASLSNIITFSQLMLQSLYKNNFDFNIASSQLSSQSLYKVNLSLNDLQKLKAASYKDISDA